MTPTYRMIKEGIAQVLNRDPQIVVFVLIISTILAIAVFSAAYGIFDALYYKLDSKEKPAKLNQSDPAIPPAVPAYTFSHGLVIVDIEGCQYIKCLHRPDVPVVHLNSCTKCAESASKTLSLLLLTIKTLTPHTNHSLRRST